MRSTIETQTVLSAIGRKYDEILGDTSKLDAVLRLYNSKKKMVVS
jgi:hypothetical protein